jgi:uncharacterized membrane protein YsdA (DUF1294 family)
MRQLAAPDACDVSFADFAIPVAFGSLGGLVAAFAARHLARHETTRTKDAFATGANIAGFWLVGWLTFLFRQRRAHRR